ncbi:zinc-binding dehydrogenase [Actinosynnema pretiosum subsp. pretiosum]|uniref:Zinc-binding dehydrogenase n=1 Tax=Actinosynnema pretiosum subsp. pretiosum TaxID=103721 RepID=A0AA45R434_9PSEU|nr:oxidoreductase [Actinosynnema pretiosum subsp. pretiosum]QUF04502.1 zinc-binding dehydrogenase [Actinosynnema pretiosum subsp. pretiosum]
MRAVTVGGFGGPEVLVVGEVPDPVPGSGRVLVRTEAIGVGGVDAVLRRGTLGLDFPAGLPLGSEVAGTVTAVGAGGDPGWVGRRVWAFTGTGGGYAEQAAVPLDDVAELPDGLSAVDAVTLGSSATVAHFALAHGRLASGERVLVRGASGSIGIAAVELAAAGGASVVAVTTSSPERGARLREHGATHVLDRAGRGDGAGEFDVVVDVVGGADLPGFLDLLAPGGRWVLAGAVAGFPPADFGAALMRGFQRSRSFATFSLATVPVAERNRVRARLLAGAVTGEVTPVVHTTLPLAEAAQAHRLMDEGGVFGRIVLLP